MRNSLLSILLIFLLLPPVFAARALQDHSDGFNYIFTVHESGWVDIHANFSSSEPGMAWIAVPKFHEYYLRVLSGSLIRNATDQARVGSSEWYFYNNFSFSFTRNAALELGWSYRFGALIVEPRGAFFSTLVGFDPHYRCTIEVRIPSRFQIDEIYLNDIHNQYHSMSETESYKVITFDSREFGDFMVRVLVSFNVTGEESIDIENRSLIISIPPRYRDVAENLSRAYDQYIDRILGLTSGDEMNLTALFFVPEDVEQITTLGYTQIRLGEEITMENVSLNAALVRYPAWTLEQTFLHELLHQYMAQAGLTTELRWAHEGLADYISISLLKEDGISVELDTIEEAKTLIPLISRAGPTSEGLGFLAEWRGGGLPPNPGLYYLASLYIAYNLSEDRGGMELYRRFFELMTEDGVMVNTVDLFIAYMSGAAGEDLAPVFEDWGFEFGLPSVATRIAIAEREAKRAPWYNPFNWLMSMELERARKLMGEGRLSEVSRLIDDVLFLVSFGPLLGSVVLSFLGGVIAWLLTRLFGGLATSRIEPRSALEAAAAEHVSQRVIPPRQRLTRSQLADFLSSYFSVGATPSNYEVLLALYAAINDFREAQPDQ